MRIYVAGPMSNVPHFNFPMFNKVTAILRAQGHEVFNPAERDLQRSPTVNFAVADGNPKTVMDQGFSLREALADDMDYICRHADAICMLPGWESSPGARAEHALSVALKHTILYHPGAYR